MATIAELKNKREQFNRLIQTEYDNRTTYEDKLVYIFNVLSTSQNEYLKYTNQPIMSSEELENLKEELSVIPDLDDNKFIDFIVLKLMNKNFSKHIFLTADKDSETTLLDSSINVSRPLDVNNINYSIQDGILYLSIKSFSKKFLENDKIILNQIKEQLANSDVKDVILDIRGNGGGTDTYFNYLSMLFDKDITLKEEFRDLFTNRNEFFINSVISGGTYKHYNVYLLVDNKVFSTAERLANSLKRSQSAILIGEQTQGEGFGMTPTRLKLVDSYNGKLTNPSKNISLQFTTEAPIENNKINYETNYATIPDILCKSEEALDVVLTIIQNQRIEYEKYVESAISDYVVESKAL